jgi:zinc transport system ATP-binding protein
MAVIEFEDVSFTYRERDLLVLKNASFKIEAGEFFGIIGPNGGGKTTLLKLVMGFLKPTSGKIRVFGKTPQAARSEIAYVPQTQRFDRQFPISVLELVLGGRLSHLPWYGSFSAQDKQAAREALAKVGLSEYAEAPFGTLSGGQAQRALIARALVTAPKLLLLDEPTASVDIQAEADICHLLHDLKGQMTMLMVTHDLKTILNDVQRVLYVQQEVHALLPKEVCEHFAIGLYHPPLINLSGQES